MEEQVKQHPANVLKNLMELSQGLMRMKRNVFRFPNKVLGSDLDMRGPSLDAAPWVELRASGTRLRYRDPRHNARCPLNAVDGDLDLYDLTQYQQSRDGALVRLFYTKGWAFQGRHRRGGINATGRIFYRGKSDETGSNYFDKSALERGMLQYCHATWGRENQSSSIGDIGTARIDYPLKSSDFFYCSTNGSEWCVFKVQASGQPPLIIHALPITASHLLVMDFDLVPYLDWNFYGPDTNMEEATHKFVKAFMDNFHVELSEEAKAQRAAVEEPVL